MLINVKGRLHVCIAKKSFFVSNDSKDSPKYKAVKNSLFTHTWYRNLHFEGCNSRNVPVRLVRFWPYRSNLVMVVTKYPSGTDRYGCELGRRACNSVSCVTQLSK